MGLLFLLEKHIINMEGETPTPAATPAAAAPETSGAPAERGGGDRGRGDRGRGFGGRGGRGGFKEEWTPLTKLGRLVKNNKIESLEEIYTHSTPIKEAQIVDTLVAKAKHELSDEVMCIL